MSQKSDSETESSQAPVIYTVEETGVQDLLQSLWHPSPQAQGVELLAPGLCQMCKEDGELDSSPSIISCPFCRHETHVPDEEIWLLQDDSNILAILTYQDRARRVAPHPAVRSFWRPTA